MEHDLDGLWAIALQAVEVHEQTEVLAWLVGMRAGEPGQTERIGSGERDVLLLLPDRLVFVRPAPYEVWSYPRDQVVGIQFPAGHVRIDVTSGDTSGSVEFWFDPDLTKAESFEKKTEGWVITKESSSGCGAFVFGIAVVVAALAFLYAVGGPGRGPSEGSPLTGSSTCGDFLEAGVGEQLALLSQLFEDAGRPDEAEKPTTLEASRRHCGGNGSATVDSLVTGR